MRVAISNIAWPTEMEAELPSVLASHGVDAVDVAPSRYFPNVSATSGAEIAAVRRWWESRGIAVTGMQALLFGTRGLNLFGRPRISEAMLEYLEQVCRIGGGLGATRLVFGSPQNRNRDGFSEAEAWGIATEFFRRLGDVAVAQAVVICLEPNPTVYGCNFLTATSEAAAMVREVDHPAIRLHLDTGVITINSESAADELLAYSDLVGHVHASEPHLLPLGQGRTDHMAAAQAIRRHCPDRVVTIEMLPAKSGFVLADVERALTLARTVYGGG